MHSESAIQRQHISSHIVCQYLWSGMSTELSPGAKAENAEIDVEEFGASVTIELEMIG